MADFTRVPLIVVDPVTGNRKPVGVAVLSAATYEVLEYKVFHDHDVPVGWRKVLLNE
jgi:hypothetical protein